MNPTKPLTGQATKPGRRTGLLACLVLAAAGAGIATLAWIKPEFKGGLSATSTTELGDGRSRRLVEAAEAWTRPKSCDRFIILSQQRSGSGFVVDVLNSNPEMTCSEELFATKMGVDHSDWGAMRARMDAEFERQCSGYFSRPKAVGF